MILPGFKCYRRSVLENIGLTNFSSVGYNFQIETTYKAHLAGFKIVEIPIMFTERAEGKSKFSLRIILESFWKVLVLKSRGGK
jgi:dolichol-phosphate mannosyltransferase